MYAPPFAEEEDLTILDDLFTLELLDAIGPFGAGVPFVVVLGAPLFVILATRFIYIISL
jgi:hypothetical protein